MAEVEDTESPYIKDVRQLQEMLREMKQSQHTLIAQVFSTVKPKDAAEGLEDLWLEVQNDEAERHKLLLDNFLYDIHQWQFLDASAEKQFFGDPAFNAALLSYAYAYHAKRAVKQVRQAVAEKSSSGSPVHVRRECISAIVEAWEVFTEGLCFSLAQNVYQHGSGLRAELHETVHKVLIGWVGSRTNVSPNKDVLEEMPGEVASRAPNLKSYGDFKGLPGSVDYGLRRKPKRTNRREVREVDLPRSTVIEDEEGSFIEDSIPAVTDEIEEFQAKEMILNAAGLTQAQMEALCYHRAGYLYAEIADIMGVDEGTVGQHLSRARRKIKKHLIE